MKMGFDFEKFKLALSEAKDKSFIQLKKDINCVREIIEKSLTAMLESTASKSRADYSGLEMM